VGYLRYDGKPAHVRILVARMGGSPNRWTRPRERLGDIERAGFGGIQSHGDLRLGVRENDTVETNVRNLRTLLGIRCLEL